MKSPLLNTAMILAAGRGERRGPHPRVGSRVQAIRSLAGSRGQGPERRRPGVEKNCVLAL